MQLAELLQLWCSVWLEVLWGGLRGCRRRRFQFLHRVLPRGSKCFPARAVGSRPVLRGNAHFATEPRMMAPAPTASALGRPSYNRRPPYFPGSWRREGCVPWDCDFMPSPSSWFRRKRLASEERPQHPVGHARAAVDAASIMEAQCLVVIHPVFAPTTNPAREHFQKFRRMPAERDREFGPLFP